MEVVYFNNNKLVKKKEGNKLQKICIQDSRYPKSLKRIKNPPITLYIEGNFELLKSTSIAIIGSRNASESGKLLAKKFATELSKIGITIISGLAKGIDSTAHYNSINNIGKTIAVLGCGFNNIFPKDNMSLYKEILKNDGLIISEYPPNIEAKSSYFIQRNRIISGLSQGVIIVEANHRSGTSTTVAHAKKQNKPIFSIPHELWTTNGVGTNRFIKNGAILLTETSQLLTFLKLKNFKDKYFELKNNGEFKEFNRISLCKYIEQSLEKNFEKNFKIKLQKAFNTIPKNLYSFDIIDFINSLDFSTSLLKIKNHKFTQNLSYNNTNYETIPKSKKSKIIKNSNNKELLDSNAFNFLSNNSILNYSNKKEQKIYEILKNKQNSVPITANQISQDLKIPINEILSTLFILELNGLAKKVSGGYICI